MTQGTGERAGSRFPCVSTSRFMATVHRLLGPASLVLALLVGTPASGACQWLSDRLWLTAQERSTRSVPPTHWVEGATIGAAIVGTTGALGTYELVCHYSDNRSDCNAGLVILGGVAGGVVGGIVGALVGGAFPAATERPLRGQPRRAALIGAAAGALWSFGLFFHFCADGCRSEEVILGLSTTSTGALAGFLIGR